MSVTHVVGVDPGLVHTGAVRMVFDAAKKRVKVEHFAAPGKDAAIVRQWATSASEPLPWPHVFIEKYQPRSHLNTDAEMTKLLVELKQRLPSSQVLLNTGVKKVVKKPLMELLDVWKFSTVTHHQDLRSAARIAVLGMLKNNTHNALLTRVVRDHLAGRTWGVHS